MSQTWDFDYPEVGVRKSFLLYHEEEESLVQNIKGLMRIRFWMTFGDAYIQHLTVLQNVGMTSIEPVKYQEDPVKVCRCVLHFIARLLLRTRAAAPMAEAAAARG